MRKTIAEEELSAFAPRDELPPELAGLDAHLLAELHDCTLKFGLEDPNERVRRLSTTKQREVCVTISTHPGNHMIVVVGAGGVTVAGTHVIRIGPETSPFSVLWDKRVTVGDARFLVEETDCAMMKDGVVSSETGERLACPRLAPSTPMRVDAVFAQQGTALVIPPGFSSEEARQQFDHPELVATVVHDEGILCLCHVRDVPHIERRRRVAHDVLARRGLTAEQMGNLPFEAAAGIRKEINDRLAQ